MSVVMVSGVVQEHCTKRCSAIGTSLACETRKMPFQLRALAWPSGMQSLSLPSAGRMVSARFFCERPHFHTFMMTATTKPNEMGSQPPWMNLSRQAEKKARSTVPNTIANGMIFQYEYCHCV